MSGIQWWCVAQTEPWSWSWQPYPGVWLLVGLVGFAYYRLVHPTAAAEPGASSRAKAGWFALGLALLWGGLDWPLGALGASYLASVHMVQYLMVGIAAPAFFLLGIPRNAWERLRERRRVVRLIRPVTHPVVALVVFNAGMTVTHWPTVVDGLMGTQAGSFVLDVAWILFGLVLWWPLIAPVPARPGFHPLLRIAYLAGNAIVITPPVAMMLFSQSPIYATYELAPPVGGTTALWDQQRAGALMKVGSGWIMALAMIVVFLRWWRSAREEPVPGR